MSDATPAHTRAAVLRRGAEQRPLWVPVAGGSMAPAIPSGGQVLVTARDRPRRGEVWAFCADPDRVIVHRFLGRAADGRLWFRGDANARPDAPIGPELLVGRVAVVDVGGRHQRLGRRAIWSARLRLDLASGRRRLARWAGRRHRAA